MLEKSAGGVVLPAFARVIITSYFKFGLSGSIPYLTCVPPRVYLFNVKGLSFAMLLILDN